MKKLFVVTLALCLCAAPLSAGDKKEKKAKGESTTVTAFVTDAMCGAKGNTEKHADCAKKCIEGGSKVALVTADNKVWSVENPEALKGHAGQKVTVTGTTSGDSFKVESVEIAGAGS